jgi:hypothetical protein
MYAVVLVDVYIAESFQDIRQAIDGSTIAVEKC